MTMTRPSLGSTGTLGDESDGNEHEPEVMSEAPVEFVSVLEAHLSGAIS